MGERLAGRRAQGGQEEARTATRVGWRYSLMLVFAFPRVVWLLMLLEVLDHYRLNGLKFIQTMYVVNDLGFDDVEASFLLGIKGTMDTVFAIAGGFVVDAIGVRRTAILGLCVGLPGRMIWAFDFSGSRFLLYLACFVFSPFGEALLNTGLYKVALKKFTTPSIRPFAYAVQCKSVAMCSRMLPLELTRKAPSVRRLFQRRVRDGGCGDSLFQGPTG